MSDYLEIKLKEYSASNAHPFHMPGHKRSMNPLEGQPGIYGIDITEIDGFDNLHDPQEILKTEMERAARLWGAKETFFSVNGSTCAILVAISAAVRRGGRILVERGCHMSVYHAAYLRELEISYIEQVPSGEGGRHCIPEGTDAVVITSPSYEGVVRDIRAWADAAHAHGAVLIVDEAHGAHLGFHPYFPDSAVHLGADLVAQSTHKTLPAMTQTALLHVASDRVDARKVRFFFDIYETSSPSYVLMASITSAVHLLEKDGAALFGNYAQRLKKTRDRLSRLGHFTLDADGVRDPGKLVIRAVHPDAPHRYKGSVVHPDGPWLYDVLRDEYNIQTEMRGPDYVLAMTSCADTDAALCCLAQVMETIDGQLAELPGMVDTSHTARANVPAPTGPAIHTGAGADGSGPPADKALPPKLLPICKACECTNEPVALAQAVGRIAADFVILYPPDAPLIVPGEVFTQDLIRDILSYKKRGFQIIGADEDMVLCVKNE